MSGGIKAIHELMSSVFLNRQLQQTPQLNRLILLEPEIAQL